MKVQNMKSPSSGQDVANQFLITEEGRGANGNFVKRETFQSYESIIAVRTVWRPEDVTHRKDGRYIDIVLDEKYWDYSTTTGKYRNQFLGEDIKETRRKIKEGIYTLENLNK